MNCKCARVSYDSPGLYLYCESGIGNYKVIQQFTGDNPYEFCVDADGYQYTARYVCCVY